MFTAKVDTSKMNYLMAELAAENYKDLNEIIKDQTKVILGNLIAVTPPGKRQGNDFLNKKGYISNAAFQNAKKVITSDVAKLFPTSAVEESKLKGQIAGGKEFKTALGLRQIKQFAGSIAELERIHKQSRNKRGRVNAGRASANMALTRTQIKNEFKKRQFAKIGLLNAGWLNAARDLKLAKAATPKWITRHAAKPGYAIFRKSKRGLAITIANKVNYYPKDAAARINQSIYRSERNLRALIGVAMKKNADKTNRKMRRK